MTATIDPPQLSEGQPRNESLRLLPISVNLLPDEVVNARISRSASRVTAGALAVVVLAMGGWYYHAHQQTSAAQDDLASARSAAARAEHSQSGFSELKSVKGEIVSKQSQLKQVTARDVAWSRLFMTVRHQLPPGVSLTGMAGTAAVSQAASGGSDSSADAPGSIMVSGQAPNKSAISTFSLNLLKIAGVTSANVTTVTAGSSGKPQYTFTIQVNLGRDAGSTRFQNMKAVK